MQKTVTKANGAEKLGAFELLNKTLTAIADGPPISGVHTKVSQLGKEHVGKDAITAPRNYSAPEGPFEKGFQCVLPVPFVFDVSEA